MDEKLTNALEGHMRLFRVIHPGGTVYRWKINGFTRTCAKMERLNIRYCDEYEEYRKELEKQIRSEYKIIKHEKSKPKRRGRRSDNHAGLQLSPRGIVLPISG